MVWKPRGDATNSGGDVISLGFRTDEPTRRRGLSVTTRMSRSERASSMSAAGLSQSVGRQDILFGRSLPVLITRQLRQEAVVDLPFPFLHRATILQAEGHAASLVQEGHGVDLTPESMSGLIADRALRG